MSIRQKIGYVLLAIFLVFLVFISGFTALVGFFVSFFFYACILFILSYLWNLLRKKEQKPVLDFLLKFASGIGYSLLIILVLLGGFTFLQNEIRPAKMPVYTLSDGSKTVVFQSMSHIGTRSFYDSVQANIRTAKENGYVLFFEGIKPGTDENMRKFNEAIGIEFDADLYKNFSKLYGVVAQDNNDFLGLVNDQDYNIDLSIDTVMEIYEGKKTEQTRIPSQVIDASGEITKILAELNPKELSILVYLNQAILNTIIASSGIRDTILSAAGNTDLFDVILEDRNEYLVNEILESEFDKIVITYGLMHFEGVYDLLQQNDTKWSIVKTEYLYPIKK